MGYSVISKAFIVSATKGDAAAKTVGHIPCGVKVNDKGDESPLFATFTVDGVYTDEDDMLAYLAYAAAPSQRFSLRVPKPSSKEARFFVAVQPGPKTAKQLLALILERTGQAPPAKKGKSNGTVPTPAPAAAATPTP